MYPHLKQTGSVFSGQLMSVKTRMDPTMTQTTHKVTAGLVFLGMRALDITAITKRIAHTLEQLGVELTAQRCLSEQAAVVRTREFDLRVTVERKRHIAKLDLAADHYIGLTLMREDGPLCTDPEASQTVLAHTLAALHVPLAPDFVQWTEPDALLTRAEFRAAINPPQDSDRRRARKRPGRERLPDVETAYSGLQDSIPGAGEHSEADEIRLRALRAAFCDPEPEEIAEPYDGIREPTAPLRLSVWMMTITLGIFALPVAAALTVFNLLRGENLRLASHTAALTGLFMALQASGAMADVLTIMQSIGT